MKKIIICFISFVIISLLVVFVSKFFLFKKVILILPPTDPYKEKVYLKEETFNNVPFSILERLIQSESSWNMYAENKNKNEHSVGLAQVNMKYFTYFKEKYNLQDPYKPSQAIDFASKYLYDLYKQTGSWYLAVLSYKCGKNNIKNAPEHIKKISRYVAYGIVQ